MGNGITHLYLGRILDTRDDVTYLTGTQFLARNHVHLEYSNLISIIFHARIEELHLITLADDAILDLEVGDNTTEGIEHGVENQSLKRCLVITLWMRNTIDNSLKNIFYTLTGLTRRTEDVFTLATNEINDFVFYLLRHSRRHIYLVDDRNNLQVMIYSHI